MADIPQPGDLMLPDPELIEGLSKQQYLDGVRRFMEHLIPFNRLLGIQVSHLAPGEAHLLLPGREEHVGNPFVPALHGGCLSALADTAGGAAVFSAAQYGDVVSTIDLRIDYLRPAAPVDTVAEAEVVRIGGRVGVTRIRMWQQADAANDSPEARTEDGERRLVAEATGVYSIRRGKKSGKPPRG